MGSSAGEVAGWLGFFLTSSQGIWSARTSLGWVFFQHYFSGYLLIGLLFPCGSIRDWEL